MSINWNHNKEQWEQHKEYLRKRAINNKEMYQLAKEIYYNGDKIAAEIEEKQRQEKYREMLRKWYFGYISNQ